MGDEPNGVISSLNYSAVHESKLNSDFVKAFHTADATKKARLESAATAARAGLAATDLATAQKNAVQADSILKAAGGNSGGAAMSSY